MGPTAASSECVSILELSGLCPVKPTPVATPPALPEASALLAVTEADCCLIWGVADGTDVGSPVGIWPGLRERKKRYVLGGVLGLERPQ